MELDAEPSDYGKTNNNNFTFCKEDIVTEKAADERKNWLFAAVVFGYFLFSLKFLKISLRALPASGMKHPNLAISSLSFCLLLCYLFIYFIFCFGSTCTKKEWLIKNAKQ